jgi:hypothetical protein
MNTIPSRFLALWVFWSIDIGCGLDKINPFIESNDQ